jgi:hypothetical protein
MGRRPFSAAGFPAQEAGLMIKLSSMFWLLLVSAAALATFAIKYEVQGLDDRLAEARKATATESRELRVLDAEWAYLNRPEMLAEMNRRFLALEPITRQQLQTAPADIPMRPSPPPPTPILTDAGSAPGAAADISAPAAPLPLLPGSVNGPAAPVKPAMASPSAEPLSTKSIAPAAPPPPRFRSVDSRSLDQLFARIAIAR